MTAAAARKLPLSGKALGAIVRVVFVLIGVSPFLPLLLGGVPVLSAIGDLFERWFAYQCHREPWRSLSVFGHVLPVCSRCTGIYWGLGLGALVLRPRLGAWPLRIWVGFAALVMVLDVWTELLGMRPASGWLRVATGMLLSYPVGVAVVWACRDLDLPPEAEAR
jgi:uncharacterized membrane protein